jgi:predicted AAA+ superfamily ATPase
MSEDIAVSLRRIADALERLAPPAAPAPLFTGATVFRHDAASGRFLPAPDFLLPLDLLVGVDRQKARLLECLERFAVGLPANHVLLWGVRGAGKSSLAKAAFMAVSLGAPDMRLVEIDSDSVTDLPALFEVFRGRSERFVVLCDDLSFEEGAAAAKALKSALEGGVAGPPDNVLLLATSNRRHLMPRTHAESGGPLAAAEDTEEEVSVSDRFGAWIGFGPMDQAAYLAAVRGYATRFSLADDDLERRALQWARLRGARSGRVAWQFTRDLAGEQGKALPL